MDGFNHLGWLGKVSGGPKSPKNNVETASIKLKSYSIAMGGLNIFLNCFKTIKRSKIVTKKIAETASINLKSV